MRRAVNGSKLGRSKLGSLLFCLCIGILGHSAMASTLAADGRTLHVSPDALRAEPKDLQFRSISEAARVVEPGDRVVIHTGVYRERVVIDRDGTRDRPICFEVAPAARVIVTGADRLTEWRREEAPEGENVFSTAWPHRFIGWSKTGTHPSDDYHKLIGRAEQVFVDDYPLHQVLRRDQLSRGSFFADLQQKRLYIHPANNAAEKGDQPLRKTRVEASARGTIWEVKGEYVETRGIRFRYAANQAQQAGAVFRGRGNVIEDCVFERTNAEGAAFLGSDQRVARCIFQENGEFGWTAGRAHNLQMTECATLRNNTKNFMRGWAAGGVKIVFTRGMVIERSRFEDNRGVGLWFDIDNRSNTVRNCFIANNEDAGLFYEISSGLHALDNVVIGNGFAGTAGAWGMDGGISLSSSPGCLVERNLLIGNKEGFQFREQLRTTPLIEGGKAEVPILNHDHVVRHNVFALNDAAQLWGWFATADERHWPAAMQQKARETGKAGDDLAAAYAAKDESGQPTGLSLEKLKITLQTNVYAMADAQGLFNWGAAWQRNVKYKTLDSVRQELGLEQGSIVAGIEFADYLKRDLRVRPNSPALKLGAYPRGEVPGVRLGVIE